MPSQFPSLLPSAILFAHRGARAHAPENTLEAFQLGLRLGATGLESDVWLTSDGCAVLDHDGVVGKRFRKHRIAETPRADLPGHMPTLEELYKECGTDFELSLDVKDPAAVDEVLRVARSFTATPRLWLCHPDVATLAEWRGRSDAVLLVNSTRLAAMDHGPERRAADLREHRIDAVNLHHSDWSAGLVALFHRFRRSTLGWDAQYERTIRALLAMGIDGVYGDHVDRLVDVAGSDQTGPVAP